MRSMTAYFLKASPFLELNCRYWNTFSMSSSVVLSSEIFRASSSMPLCVKYGSIRAFVEVDAFSRFVYTSM